MSKSFRCTLAMGTKVLKGTWYTTFKSSNYVFTSDTKEGFLHSSTLGEEYDCRCWYTYSTGVTPLTIKRNI